MKDVKSKNNVNQVYSRYTYLKHRPKQHKLLDRPFLSSILLFVVFELASVFINIVVVYLVYFIHVLLGAQVNQSQDSSIAVSYNSVSVITSNISLIIFSLLVLFWFKLRFKPKYKGVFCLNNFAIGCLCLLPLLVYAVMTNIASCDFNYLSFGIIIAALVPAVSEEVLFRGIIGINLIRLWLRHKKIVYVMIVPSLIFGLAHTLNILGGANIYYTFMQVIFAFSMGMCFMAAIIRSGNITPLILAHFLIDLTGFLNPEVYKSGGIVETEFPGFFSMQAFVIYFFSALIILWSLILVRRTKRPYILNLWNLKFGIEIKTHIANLRNVNKMEQFRKSVKQKFNLT